MLFISPGNQGLDKRTKALGEERLLYRLGAPRNGGSDVVRTTDRCVERAVNAESKLVPKFLTSIRKWKRATRDLGKLLIEGEFI